MGNCDTKEMRKAKSPSQTSGTASPERQETRERACSINFEIQCPTVIDEEKECPTKLARKDPSLLIRKTDVDSCFKYGVKRQNSIEGKNSMNSSGGVTN